MKDFLGDKLKETRFSKANLVIFGLIFGVLGGYAIWHSFATSTIKPPLQGLIQESDKAPPAGYEGAVGGIIAKVNWSELQPTSTNDPIPANNTLDKAIQTAKDYNTAHPNTPIYVKLRLMAGTNAPDWAKTLGGFTPVDIVETQSGQKGTIGPFWTPAYATAYQNLQAKLAAKYDSEQLLREVTISQCMSFFAEPFQRTFTPIDPVPPTNPPGWGKLYAQGYTVADDKNCLQHEVDAHTVWTQTHSSLAFNPYGAWVCTPPGYLDCKQGSFDEAFTASVMDYCLATLHTLCTLENNSIRESYIIKPPPLYKDIQLRASNPTPPPKRLANITLQPAGLLQVGNYHATVQWAVSLGANAVEYSVGAPYMVADMLVDNQALLKNPSPDINSSTPTVSISAAPPSINSGGSSTLTWTSTNASSCDASGGWSGSKPTSGSANTGALTSTTTFNLDCTGPGGTTSASTTVTVLSSAAWWHVNGTTILDENNQPVRITGANDGRLESSSDPSDSDFQTQQTWGFNTVRVPINWAHIEPTMPTGSPENLTHSWNEPYLQRIDQLVTKAKAHNIHVILDMHQSYWAPVYINPASNNGHGFPAWLYCNPSPNPPDLSDPPSIPKLCPNGGPIASKVAKCQFLQNTHESWVTENPQDGIIAAWKQVVSRYADNPTVIGADIFNEPQPCNGSFNIGGTYPLDKFYHDAGVAIRALAPNMVLLYEDDAYNGYGNFCYALQKALDLPNTVYSWHFYPATWDIPESSCDPSKTPPTPQNVASKDQLAGHLARANSWNVPLWIGEFNGFEMGKFDCSALPTAHDDLVKLMSYTKANNISWSFWTYKSNNSSIIDTQDQTSPPCPAPHTHTNLPREPLLTDLRAGLGTPPSPAPTVSLSANPTTITSGQSSTLTWNSTNATSCSASGAWSGNKATSGSESTGPLTITSTFNLACSGAGGSASASATVTVNPSGDTQPPTVSITAPAAGATVKGSSVTISADASDNVGVAGVQFKLDGNNQGNEDNSSPYSTIWDTTTLGNGAHSLTALARDAAGNTTLSASVTVTVNNPPPPADTTPPSVPTGLRSPSKTDTSISLAWDASTDNPGGTGVAGYRIYRNSSLLTSTTLLNLTDTGLSPSTSYSYTVAAYDNAGNSSAQSPAISVKTDSSPPPPPPNPAPTVSLSASPATINSGESSTLTWSSTNATSCSASGAWSGNKATSGSESTGPLTITSTFNLACSGSGGSGSASTTVTVNPSTPPPPPPPSPNPPPGSPPPPPPSIVVGDLNGDGHVDIIDLSILLSAYGTDQPIPDLNHDTIVGVIDLSILLSNYGR